MTKVIREEKKGNGVRIYFECDLEGCHQKDSMPKSTFDKLSGHYCSDECREKDTYVEYKCDTCGAINKARKSQFEKSEHHFCNRECFHSFTGDRNYVSGKEHGRWQGGRVIDAKGYVRLDKAHIPEDLKEMVTVHQGRFVYEHQLEAVKKLGRPIEEGKEIHHIDGDTQNNSHDNLLEVTRKEHKEIHSQEE